MERLTTNKGVSEMGMFELAHNSCYAKDGKARYRDYDLDIDARELTRKLLKDYADSDDSFTDDEDFDDWMMDYLQDGMDSIEGLIALFYRNLWAMADLHKKLKHYEDLKEQGKLLITPHAVGDIVYTPIFDRMHDPQTYVSEALIEDVSAKGAVFADDFVKWEDFGKYEFFTREAAEAALEEMGNDRERIGKMGNDKNTECCGNCKKYMLNGGKCTGIRSRHCKKYKGILNDRQKAFAG